jgi:methyl-accepting chemotaxis protein
LRRMIGGVTKAMAEQASAMAQNATASETMRVQADQTARALQEQARTMKEMTTASQNASKQIKLISHANKEHSTVSGSLLAVLGEIRQTTERNASGVRKTRGGTDDLVRRAGALTALVGRPTGRRANGRTARKPGA